MQRNILIGLAGVVVLVAVGFLAWKMNALPGVEPEPSVNATSSASSQYGVNADSSGEVSITPLPVPAGSDPLPAHPAIDRPVTIPNSLSGEAKAILLGEIASLRSRLKADPRDLAAWIDLGARYRAIDEYEAAREAWEYVSLVSPSNVLSFNNLGDLQHYVLKDYARAELNFKQAIKNDPRYLLSYLNLFDLYRLSYMQGTSKAPDTLTQGLKANPGAIDLMVALASYYRDAGKKAEAKTYYEQAIEAATKAGNNSLVVVLKAELKALE